MGFELDIFVHPERISSQLICSICQGVLERPVQTPTDHLFCEDELLEWMTRSNKCPITNKILNPDSIRKPSRIISNMLGELERYCSNKERGCLWKGPLDQYNQHELNCDRRPIENLLSQLNIKNEKIKSLEKKITILDKENNELQYLANELYNRNCQLESRLKVYEAFVPDNSGGHSKNKRPQMVPNDYGHEVEDIGNVKEEESDLQRISRLYRFDEILKHHRNNQNNDIKSNRK